MCVCVCALPQTNLTHVLLTWDGDSSLSRQEKVPTMDYKRTTVVAMQKHDLFWIIRPQRMNCSERACFNGAQKLKVCRNWAIGLGERGCERRAGGEGSSNTFTSALSHRLRERETGRKNKKGQKEGEQLSFRALIVGETILLGTFKAL